MTETAWHGNEDLRELLVPIDELRPHPQNPRRGNLAAIAKSLDRFGQQRPILALPDGTIVAGRHTWGAAMENLQWSHVAVVRSDLTDDEVMGYLLADNRTAELGDYDDELLGEALTEQYEKGKLEGTGYDEEAYREILAAADAAISQDGRSPADEERDAFERLGLEDENDPPRLDELEDARPTPFTIPVTLDAAARRQFLGWLRGLQHEWEAESYSEVLYRCVREAAVRVHEGTDAEA